jgi:hypothetical protein
MKNKLLILFLFTSTFGFSQQTPEIFISKSWIGTIKLGDTNPQLVFDIFIDSIGKLAGTLGVPSKGIKGIPLSYVLVKKDSILLEISPAQAGYKGIINREKQSIEGTWKEGENTYPLILKPLTEQVDYDNPNKKNTSSLDFQIASKHFDFYSRKSDYKVLDSLANILEKNYLVITDHLQTKFTERINVYIYPDLESFHSAIYFPNAPDWVVGAASKNELKMVSPLNPGSAHNYESLMQAIVHEFAHTVILNLREQGLVGLPKWLNEGYAFYEAHQLTDNMRTVIKTKLADKTIPSWSQLNHAETVEFGNINGYELSSTIIEFLVKFYGYDDLRKIIISPDKIEEICGTSLENLETMWLKYLKDS